MRFNQWNFKYNRYTQNYKIYWISKNDYFKLISILNSYIIIKYYINNIELSTNNFEIIQLINTFK